MTRVVGGNGLRRTHIETALMRESLIDKHVLSRTACARERSLVPRANVICLGGRSIIDRGAKVLFPLIEEIVSLKEHYQLIVGVGSGTRGRHTFAIATDLGIPTGGLAALVGAVEEQNSKLIWALLSPYGGIHLIKDNLLQLPLYLQAGMIPVTVGIPPYRFWEPPHERSPIPLYGPDCGLFLLAEVLGAQSIIYLKDQDGLFTDDPKRDAAAKFLGDVTIAQIEALDLPDLIVERELLKLLGLAHHFRKLHIVNGLVPGNLTRALRGVSVGTVVFKDEASRQ